MDNREYVESLRELADFYEQHAELEIPYEAEQVTVFAWTIGEEKRQLAKFIRAFGSCTKHYNKAFEGAFQLEKKFSGITLRVLTERDRVCERVVLGTRVVPEQVIPASEEKIIPEHTEDDIEWLCSESAILGALGAEEVSA